MAPSGAGRSRFSWDALSVTNATSCGYNKCYFPPQLSERENEGWLVGLPRCETHTDASGRGLFPQDFGCDDVSASTPWFPQWSRTWTFAEQLHTRFGVGHMLSRPPEIAILTTKQATSLNFKLEQRRVDLLHPPLWPHPGAVPGRGRTGATSPRYFSPGPHPLQAVRPCPWPSCIMLGCVSLKAHSFIRGAKSFIAHAPNKTKLSHGIRRNFAGVAAMVKAHPCLKIDFQVFLRNDGNVLNMDLDRCDQLALGNSADSPPLSEALQRNMTAFQLELAGRPGLCGLPRHQRYQLLRLDKALESLYVLDGSPPWRRRPSKVAVL